MYLCIYRRGNKFYFNVNKKLTEKITIANQDMETIKLGYKQLYCSYVFNSFADLKRIRKELEPYKLRYVVIRNKFRDITQVKLTIFLMNNVLYDAVLGEEEIHRGEIEKDSVSTSVYEIFEPKDIAEAQKEFGCFKVEDFPDIF